MNIIERTDKATNETLFYTKHPSGLDIYIQKKSEYKKCHAIFATKYGSIDSSFVVPGEDVTTTVPDGIAHYLEHKMFEEPDGSNIFDKFAQHGASANAFTSFDKTAYYFTCTSDFYQNLETLLGFVQRPYFTDENVQKERGIIGQEIRMYDDSPNWRLFFNTLNALYNKHTIKKDIAGTVESIAQIDKDVLYKCYNTFYNLNNMVLFVIGGVDVDKTLECINANIVQKPSSSEPIKRVYPVEDKKINQKYIQQNLSVSIPLFMIGFKDTEVSANPQELFKKSIECEIISKILFGKSSELYRNLYDNGLINDNFGAEYSFSALYENSFAHYIIEGESSNPQKVFDEVISYIKTMQNNGIPVEIFERAKKVVWSEYITLFNNIENVSHAFIDFLFKGINLFEYSEVYNTVTIDSTTNRLHKLFKDDNVVLSVVKPNDQ